MNRKKQLKTPKQIRHRNKTFPLRISFFFNSPARHTKTLQNQNIQDKENISYKVLKKSLDPFIRHMKSWHKPKTKPTKADITNCRNQKSTLIFWKN